MGKPSGFMEYERRAMPARNPAVRLNDFYEVYERHDEQTLKDQGARCMDCGVPFCQSETGCPIDNAIPEWNDFVFHGRWQDAYERLILTNNFPEFTGRICPAPCESACVLGITESPVTIKSIECSIIDRAFEEGWVQPAVPENRTGQTVAVVGSGPAGLAAADQLNKAGHTVTVFERDDRIGGLLMYGVPNMKLEKSLVERRVQLLRDSGITFRTNCNVGGDTADHGSASPDRPGTQNIDPTDLLRDFDAVVLACGALKARDLEKLPGRELKGVHRAMEYLWSTTKHLLDGAGEQRDAEGRWRELAAENGIDARGLDVVVIGGGDTGTDCIGTAIRQGCNSVTNITRREREPDERDSDHPWPGPTGTFYVDYGHAEGAAKFDRDPRRYGLLPLGFIEDPDRPGHVGFVEVEHLDWQRGDDGRMRSTPTGKTERLPAQLVLQSVGFTGFDTPKLVEAFGVDSEWGQVKTGPDSFATNAEKVFVAGDMRRGASLIVWAIAEGRGVARAVDEYLTGSSLLPAPGLEEQALVTI